MRRYRVGIAEIKIVNRATVLETVLGSCVAAVFWHPTLRLGAMCHGFLPVCPEAVLRSGDTPEGLRYVDYAMRYLLRRMTSKGIDPSELHVKLFGGANVLMSTNDGEPDTVGHRNCAAARRVVEEEQLRLVASDLGGARGRVIYFSTASGEVRLRRLREPEIFTVKFQLR